MTEKKIEQIIGATATKTAKMTIIELKKEKLIRTGRSPYQKVEALLFGYNNFKNLIKERNEDIKHLKKYGLDKRSKDITQFSASNVGLGKNETEVIEMRIEELERSISLTKHCIKTINKALKKIEDDKYYEVIPKIYFEKIPVAQIAEDFERDEKTIYRNKQRLINSLKLELFTDDTLFELMG